MSERHHWEVWREVEGQDDDVLCEGSKAKCQSYYKKHGGSKAGLHIGYVIPEDKDQ